MYPVPAAFEGLMEPRRGALGRATGAGILLCADALPRASQQKRGASRVGQSGGKTRVKSSGTNKARLMVRRREIQLRGRLEI